MAAALSEDEFQRLQLQLIDLRGQNYQLTDRCRLLETELTNIKNKFEATDKDLQRANKALSKNKKAKDWELLLLDNESLQQKLHSQEDEFRLQNATLMQELSTLVARNEELEALIQKMPKQVSTAAVAAAGEALAPQPAADSELLSELRRLRAANAVLQRHLDELEKAGGRNFAVSQPHGVDVVDSTSIIGDVTSAAVNHPLQPVLPDYQLQEAASTFTDQLGSNEEEFTGPKVKPSQAVGQSDGAVSLSVQCESRAHTEFRVQVETEREENRLLKLRLAEIEKSSKLDIEALQSKLDEISEKLRKKQEAFSQFQINNEAALVEARKKIEYLEDARQRDSRNHRGSVEKLHDELTTCRKDAETFKTTSLQYIAKLETMVKTLESQVSESSVAYAEQRKHELETIRLENEGIKSQLAIAVQRTESLLLTLTEQEQKIAALEAQAKDLESRLEAQSTATQDATKLAEKRKNLLDELAMKVVEDDDRYKKRLKEIEATHQLELKTMTEAHQAEVDSLGQSLDEAHDQLGEYSRVKQEVTALTQQNQSLEQAKDWLQRRLREAEDALKQMETQHAEQLAGIVKSHESDTLASATHHKKELEDLRALHQASTEDNAMLHAQIQSLQQKVKDTVNEMRLHEKKGASLLRDLKKQAGLERSRAERLEQKLQELLATDSLRTGKILSEDLSFRAASPDLANKDETSSLSSWTSHATPSGSQSRDTNLPLASHEIPYLDNPQTPPSSVDTRRHERDTSLVDELVKDKRILEEKVSMLEQSSAAMAEDLLQKQAIIEHYISEGKDYVTARPSEEKLTLKRVMDFVKDRGDESLKEKYRKAQRVLEETLTKNMFLQKDLEALSQEISRLKSKE